MLANRACLNGLIIQEDRSECPITMGGVGITHTVMIVRIIDPMTTTFIIHPSDGIWSIQGSTIGAVGEGCDWSWTERKLTFRTAL